MILNSSFAELAATKRLLASRTTNPIPPLRFAASIPASKFNFSNPSQGRIHLCCSFAGPPVLSLILNPSLLWASRNSVASLTILTATLCSHFLDEKHISFLHFQIRHIIAHPIEIKLSGLPSRLSRRVVNHSITSPTLIVAESNDREDDFQTACAN
ncbi:hypothetical protein Vadar_008363 [Vaccinium darrowii]|uniref:Uncharacterized protein n=1 Tax=Vaccinium darrowii TaxID=229202 RepID=A0ACB7XQ16_9ERIC|nr:hypothetical protein Vadar_008363 [Vaccinium darrowii]